MRPYEIAIHVVTAANAHLLDRVLRGSMGGYGSKQHSGQGSVRRCGREGRRRPGDYLQLFAGGWATRSRRWRLTSLRVGASH